MGLLVFAFRHDYFLRVEVIEKSGRLGGDQHLAVSGDASYEPGEEPKSGRV